MNALKTIVARDRIMGNKSTGGLCYGYKVLQQTDVQGEAVRGDRAIDEDEAQIIPDPAQRSIYGGRGRTGQAQIQTEGSGAGPGRWRAGANGQGR